MDVMRVIGAGQVLQMFGLAAVPGQDAVGGEEDLQEAIVLEIRDVVVLREVDGILSPLIVGLINPWVVDGGDHVLGIG